MRDIKEIERFIEELSDAGFVIVPKECIENRKNFLDEILKIIRKENEDNS